MKNADTNKLIAEFLGYAPDEDGMYLMEELVIDHVTDTYEFDEENNNRGEVTIREGVTKTGFYPQEMEFNTNWNWLMAVVDRIEGLEDKNRCARFNVNVVQCFVEIVDNENSNELVEVDGQNRMDAIYKAVVGFIKWYNVKERLEHLRTELRAERISYAELMELQSLVDHIDEGDTELLEAAGLPENN